MDFGIYAGDTDKTIYLRLRDSTTGLAKTGLAYNSAGAVASYTLPGAARAAITLATQTVTGTHSDGGFVEVDATNCKGLYRLDLPDAAIASGNFTIISIEFDGIIEESMMIPLHTKKVNVTQIGGDAQSATDLKDFADAGYDPATNKVEGVKLVDTLTTYTSNTPQTGDSFARLGAPAGASVSADVAAVKGDTAAILLDTGTDGVVVAAASKTGYSLTATTGLGNQTANITGNLSGSVGSVTGAINTAAGTITTLDALDTAQDSQHSTTQGKVDTAQADLDILTGADGVNLLSATQASIDAIETDTSTTLPNTLTTIAGYLDTEIAAILADTNELQGDWADGGRLDLLLDAVLADTNELQSDDVPGLISSLNNISTADVNAQVLDVLNVDALIDGKTIVAALRIGLAVLAGKVSGAGTGSEVFRSIDDGENAVTVTVDGDGNRSAVTYGV